MALSRVLLTDKSANVPTTSTAILGFDASRNFLLIRNEGTANPIAVNLTGGTAVLNTAGNITLAAGQQIQFETTVPTGPITAIAGTGTTPLTVLYSGSI